MAKSFEKMSKGELEAANRRLMAEKEAIREQQREINAALAQAEARAKVEALTGEEREALRQTLADVGGIAAGDDS